MTDHIRALLASAVLLSIVALPLAAQNITVTIDKPLPNDKAGDVLAIRVAVTSTYQIQAVVAEVSGRTTNLTYHGGEFRWLGELNLVGLPCGPLVLNVTAQDVFGSAVTRQVTFIHDKAPVLTVTAPLQETVARPLLRITASCTDDGPEGCEIAVKHEGESTFFMAGLNSIDQEISLEQYEGTSFLLYFRALDFAGNQVTETRRVYVDSSRRLVEFHDVTGRIFDVQPNRILHNTDPGSPSIYETTGTYLKIRDIATGTDTTIPPVPDKPLKDAFLTPRGAIFQSQSLVFNSQRLYEWQDSTLLELATPTPDRSLDAEGAYAIWTAATPDRNLFFRNILTGTTTEVPFDGTLTVPHDVAEDGTVAFGSINPHDIHLYENGIVTKLTNAGTYRYTGPQTDGTNTLYTRTTVCDCQNPPQAIVRHDGTSETEISSAGGYPRDNYQVRNGWIAVTRPGTSSELQVWRLPPPGMGNPQQVSVFGSSSRIERLAGNGDLMFLNPFQRQRLLSTVANPIQTTPVSSDLGRAFHVDDQWFVAIGRSLFTVTDAVTATTTTLTQSSSSSVQGETVTFTATVMPSSATGTVAFKDGATTLITAPLSGGTATFYTDSLALGSHSIKAVYSGDVSFASSASAPVTHLVRKPTATFVMSRPNPSNAGDNVRFTASVSGVGETGAGATGTVTLYDGDTLIGTQTLLSDQTATFFTSSLSPGTHSITARYSGDATWAPSTSTVLIHQVRSPFGPPVNVTATATSPTQVVVTWGLVNGATQYEVARSFNNGPFTTVGLVTNPTFTDQAVSPNTTYIYIVRAIGSSTSDWSNRDAATTVVFTDDPLTPRVHTIKREHLVQLRTAVNAMRASGGLAPFTFTDPALPAGTIIRAVHVQELRTVLSDARAALLLPAMSYTDPTLTTGSTHVKAVHFQELRNGCK